MDVQAMNPTPVGVVGLGLMGSSIVVALLAAGHRVVALAPIADEKEKASRHLADLLRHADEAGMLPQGIAACIERLQLVEDYQLLADCRVVMECVIEDKQIKKAVYQRIAESVRPDVVIASNTSAIPISELQELVQHPKRFLGVHWAEPAYMTRFLEVTCGKDTDPAVGQYMLSLGETWGKEPTLILKDIRGFITNRLMYAIYREALTLVEQGHTTLADADKAFRYDAGSWVTVMGIFERMAIHGGVDYLNVLKRIFPQLSNREDVPDVMQRLVEQGAKGIHNLRGLYPYTESLARHWEATFAQFNKDIYGLAAKYNVKDAVEAEGANISQET
ncbi:3-hydroxyacyl-CoA dehydrogenase family protein [Parapedobacter sp. 10938]|uniref:3-hydroxyacyl-CoA dehydrogenase family protein n=1 Tax=Parapedobacter flavus TaxID=3110225 RepID=UPI002DBF27EF|nr:3-hydroxyacyl-CoA dehydrogenase family protein [Parapedobacter sp. 10938]MEC3878576.1 3-hydroxyacyl-CoA dehydrogenase family protein [Parapedobacter sp. 10938]